MMFDNIAALQPIAIQGDAQLLDSSVTAPKNVSFSEMLIKGVEQTNAKLVEADHLVAAFAVDDSIPAHQVTYALEEARLSLELMLQVRNRVIDTYQQMMNMQV
jgi:flagellar hook-basal body complex protein FliE